MGHRGLSYHDSGVTPKQFSSVWYSLRTQLFPGRKNISSWLPAHSGTDPTSFQTNFPARKYKSGIFARIVFEHHGRQQQSSSMAETAKGQAARNKRLCTKLTSRQLWHQRTDSEIAREGTRLPPLSLRGAADVRPAPLEARQPGPSRPLSTERQGQQQAVCSARNTIKKHFYTHNTPQRKRKISTAVVPGKPTITAYVLL